MTSPSLRTTPLPSSSTPPTETQTPASQAPAAPVAAKGLPTSSQMAVPDSGFEPMGLENFFSRATEQVPLEGKSDLKETLMVLHRDLAELPGATQWLGRLETVNAWVEQIEALEVSEALKESVVRFTVSGVLTGKEAWIKLGSKQGEKLQVFSRQLDRREEVQELLNQIYPVDLRIGRAEPEQIAANVFLKTLHEVDPEVRDHIRALARDQEQSYSPKTFGQLEQESSRLASLYQSPHLQTFLTAFENNQRAQLEANSGYRQLQIIHQALDRMDTLEDHLEILKQLKERDYSGQVLDPEPLLAAGKEYRKDLLSTAEAIETELAVALDQAELDQESERLAVWEESAPMEEGEPDEPVMENELPDSPEVEALRRDLNYFRGLREEIEAIDFEVGADLAQSLEALEVAAPDYFQYEGAWVHQEIVERAEGVLRMGHGNPAAKELLDQTDLLLDQDAPQAEAYRNLLQSIESAALWSTVEARIEQYGQMHQSAWLTDGIVAAGQGALDVGLSLSAVGLALKHSPQKVDGAGPYAQMEQEYLKVLALLTRGETQAARRSFVRLETSREHANLVENFKDSQTFNQCSLNAGIVIASAGIGEIFAVGAVRAATALNVTRGLGAIRLTSNTAVFTAMSHGFSRASMGQDYFDPRMNAAANGAALGEEFLLNLGMFYFLGRSQKLFQNYANRALVNLAERRAGGALGDALVSGETRGAVATELEALSQKGWVKGGMQVGSFATELAGFGLWDLIQTNYEGLKTGHFNPLQSVENSLLNPEAWRERFVFLIALKAGGILVSPLTKPMHESVRQWAMSGHREKLNSYEAGVVEAQQALEDFLTGAEPSGKSFHQLVSTYRRALEKQGELMAAIPELRAEQTYALNQAMLEQLTSFETSFLVQETLFGPENKFGIKTGPGGATYAPRKLKALLKTLGKHPGVRDLKQHDNGLVEFRLRDPISGTDSPLHLVPESKISSDRTRIPLRTGEKNPPNRWQGFLSGLKTFAGQAAAPMPFMIFGPHTLWGSLLQRLLNPPQKVLRENNGTLPAILEGHRPVTIVRSGAFEFAEGLSQWRYVGTEGETMILELVPPREGSNYRDGRFAGKPGNQKRLRAPFGYTDYFNEGTILQILSPRAVEKHIPQEVSLTPAPDSAKGIEGHLPALLEGRRPVFLVRAGDNKTASGLSQWRYVGTEGNDILLELVPPPQDTSYQDVRFAGKPGNQKRLQLPKGESEVLKIGDILQIVPPRVATGSGPVKARYTMKQAPSGIQVRPELGEDLAAVAETVVIEEWTLMKDCSYRLVINTQSWAKPLVPSKELTGRLQAVAEANGVTVALKTAAPPYAMEFEPKAEIERQKSLGPFEAIGLGMGLRMSLSLDVIPLLSFGKITAMLAGKFPWGKTFRSAPHHQFNRHGIHFDYAVVDRSHLPELVDCGVAGVHNSRYNFVWAPLLKDPQVLPEHRNLFRDLLALHTHVSGELDGGYEKATKVELAIAQKEGVLEPYLKFLKRNGLLGGRSISFGRLRESLARDFRAMNRGTSSFINTLDLATHQIYFGPAFDLAKDFVFPPELVEKYGAVLKQDEMFSDYEISKRWGEAVTARVIVGYVSDLAKNLFSTVESEPQKPTESMASRLEAAYAQGIQPLVELYNAGLLDNAILKGDKIAKLWSRTVKYLNESLKENFGIDLTEQFPLIALDLEKQIRLLTRSKPSAGRETKEPFQYTLENALKYIVDHYLRNDLDKISHEERFLERSFTLPNGKRISATDLLNQFFAEQNQYDKYARLMQKPRGEAEALQQLRDYAQTLLLPQKFSEISQWFNVLFGEDKRYTRRDLVKNVVGSAFKENTFPLEECLKAVLFMTGLGISPEGQLAFYSEIIGRSMHPTKESKP